MGMGGQRHAPVALPPRKKLSTHFIGCWVGPRAGLDGRGNFFPPPGFDPRTVQPVASRYTGCAIPALVFHLQATLNSWVTLRYSRLWNRCVLISAAYFASVIVSFWQKEAVAGISLARCRANTHSVKTTSSTLRTVTNNTPVYLVF